jgi:hypothetical protein
MDVTLCKFRRRVSAVRSPDYLSLRPPSERDDRSGEGEGLEDGGGLEERGDSTARGADAGGE